MTAARWTAVTLALTALGACDGGSTGPTPSDRILAIQGGDGQVWVVGQQASEPLQVVVSEAATEEPIVGATVTWEVVGGPGGAVVAPATSATDSSGVASTRLTLGPAAGVYEVRATTRGMVGEPAIFRVRAVSDPPVLIALDPTAAAVGDTITLTGEHFSPTPEENRVLFGGVRGLVVSGSATHLRVVVPPCLHTGTVPVSVHLGPLSSAAAPLQVEGDGQSPLDLQPGQVVTMTEPSQIGCLRLPESTTGTEYLVIPQNASETSGAELFYQLVGLAGQGGATAVRAHSPAAAMEGPSPALLWEARVRARERAIAPGTLLPAAPADELAALKRVPVVGERKSFQVFDKDDDFTRITAEVMHVSQRAVFYQDVNAPADGFTSADFHRFGALFDDPIYPTNVRVFGAPSDIDGNDRITVLFTPVVNELTPKGSVGFVAGFFFGWDLTSGTGSNNGEIFYSVVPDPDGRFSDRRSVSRILEVVPPVLAHEFQHMIHFHQRMRLRQASSQEALWLSEALAHMAEELVGEEFLRRGDAESAADFKLDNFARARLYLQRPDTVSLIAIKQPGSLAERGASWLFLLHLMGHYGGEDLITRLTQTTRSSVSNVRAETGQSWARLFADWTVANYADGLAALEGSALESRFTYPNVNLRQVLGQGSSGYPLQPGVQAFQDFTMADTLPASSPDYLLLRVSSSTPRTLNLSFGSGRGGAFPGEARPQLTVLRVR